MGIAAPAQQPEYQVATNFYVWAFPGLPLKIHLHLETVAQMRRSLAAGESEGVEIGGLLLGKVESTRIEITGFMRFERDSLSSADFILEATEKARFLRVIQQSGEDGKGAVVGYFRSSVRGGLRLSQDDLHLIHECFPDPSNVFLVIRPDKDETPTAGFFFWDSGSILADFCFMPFPFDEHQLRSEAVAAAAVRTELRQATAAIPTDAAISNGRHRQPRVYIAALSLLGFAIIIATALYLRAGGIALFARAAPRAVFEPAPTTQPEPALLLSGVKVGTNVEITWNPQSSVIANARVGLLTIKDGETRRELPLTPTQLQARKLIYTPDADNVEVSLEIFSPDRKSVRETMLFLLSQSAVAPRVLVDNRSRSSAENTSIAEVIRVETAPAPSSNSATIPRPAFTPPAVKSNHATPNLTEPPPSSVPLSNAALNGQAPAAIIGAPQAPASPPAVQPANPPPMQAVNGAPQPEKQAVVPVQPPKATHQVRPILPANIAALVSRRVDVDVRVDVDQNGNIIRAQPLVSSGTLNAYLGNAAAAAAQLWKFEPAKQGNQSIAGAIVLKFVFEPGKR